MCQGDTEVWTDNVESQELCDSQHVSPRRLGWTEPPWVGLEKAWQEGELKGEKEHLEGFSYKNKII